MQIVIEIPESEIPKKQDVIEIPLHFIDGKVCEAGGYDFDVLPKGHGRIADMDEAIKCIEEVNGEDAIWAIGLINWACGKRTIIEAEVTEC